MKKLAIIILITTSLLISVERANAIPLFERDLINGSGDGLITLDTSTGLEWLDLTASTNRSYVDISTQFEAGGAYEGFRYATNDEVQMLFTIAGISDDFTIANYIPAVELVSLLGSTSSNSSQTWARGLSGTEYSSFSSTTHYWMPDIEIRSSGGTANADVNGFASLGYSAPSIGSWLVREASVPEPSIILLLISGLFLQISIRRITRRCS